MRGFRRGRTKFRDDESGFVFWDDDAVENWKGEIVHKRNNEQDHPQKYIRPKDDPTIARIIRPDIYPDMGVRVDDISYDAVEFDGFTSELNQPQTDIIGPASHLFLAGIGKMVIGDSNPYKVFMVRDH